MHFIAYVACTEIGLNPAPEQVTKTVTLTNTVTVPAEDTGTGTDPCDLVYREYLGDGYVDYPLDAMPEVTLPYLREATIPADVGYAFTSIEITSKNRCGPVEIRGVGVVIVNTNNAVFPYEAEVVLPNTLSDTNGDQSWDAATNPTISAIDGLAVYGLWIRWDESGPDAATLYGDYEGTTVIDETLSYNVVLPVMADLPVGEYEIYHTVHWRDPGTGTEVWYQNLDDAVFALSVTP